MTKEKKSPSGRISREAALRAHFARPKKERCRDEFETSKQILRHPTKDWRNDPDSKDVVGIDVPSVLIPAHWEWTGNDTRVWVKEKIVVSSIAPAQCSSGKPKTSRDRRLMKKGLNPAYFPKR
jgi:hypothetical protein